MSKNKKGFEFVKHCINDVKASFYKCYFLPVIIFREANALVKFVFPLRSFVVCCNNKNSLPDCVEEGIVEWPLAAKFAKQYDSEKNLNEWHVFEVY